MSFLLRLKPWLLFSVTVGAPVFMALLGNLGLFMQPHSMPLFLAGFIGSMLFFIAGLFSWLWAMGTRLPALLPPHAALSSKLLRISLLVPAVYAAAILAFMAGMFSQGSVNPAYAFLLAPIHLLSMAGTFYSIYFVAKALKSVELQRTAGFNDFLPDFFLLWFYPVGIWLIQPRINHLFSRQNSVS